MKPIYVVCDATRWLVTTLTSAGLTVQHVVPEDHNTEREETKALAEVAAGNALIVYPSNVLICGRWGPANGKGRALAPRPDLWGNEGDKLVLDIVPMDRREAVFALDNHGGADELYSKEGIRVFSTEQTLIAALRAAV